MSTLYPLNDPGREYRHRPRGPANHHRTRGSVDLTSGALVFEMNSEIDGLLTIADQIARNEIPKHQHNECFTAGAFDLLLMNSSPAHAYELLGRLCERYESIQASSTSLAGYYELLEVLARRSGTTELPLGMSVIIAEHPAFSKNLRIWYRVRA